MPASSTNQKKGDASDSFLRTGAWAATRLDMAEPRKVDRPVVPKATYERATKSLKGQA